MASPFMTKRRRLVFPGAAFFVFEAAAQNENAGAGLSIFYRDLKICEIFLLAFNFS